MVSDKALYWLAAGVLALTAVNSVETRNSDWMARLTDHSVDVAQRVSDRAMAAVDRAGSLIDRTDAGSSQSQLAVARVQSRLARVQARLATRQASAAFARAVVVSNDVEDIRWSDDEDVSPRCNP